MNVFPKSNADSNQFKSFGSLSGVDKGDPYVTTRLRYDVKSITVSVQ